MTVAQIRTITADHPQAGEHHTAGDGTTVRYRIPLHPITAASETVTIDGTATAAYTLDDNLGLLTFTAAPADEAVIVATFTHTLLSDDDLETFLLLQAGDVRLAAAMALDTIASNEALVQKKIRTLDLTTDGPAVAKSLREHAAQLREEADGDDAFDYAEMVTHPFGYDARIHRQAQRGLLV